MTPPLLRFSQRGLPGRRTAPPPCLSIWLSAGLSACAFHSAAPVVPPAPHDLRKVPPSFAEELIVRRRASSLTMRVYDTGDVRARGGDVSSMKSWDAKVRLDAPVFLIRHPTEGYILFDTGLSTRTAAALNGGLLSFSSTRYESAPGQDARAQLRADGVDPGEVRWVILSHLHLDHAGRAGDFPNATVVVSKREWESEKAAQALKPDRRSVSPAQVEGRWKLRLVDFSTAPPLGAFDHAVDLFSDGTIYLVDLPGRTPGSMGAWVDLDGGAALLAGDAATVIDNYTELALPSKAEIADVDAYWRSINEIKAMQDALPRLVVFPGHDLSPLAVSGRDDIPSVPFPRPGASSANPSRE